MVNGRLLVVRFGWRRLQQNPTLNVVNVLLAQQHGLNEGSAWVSRHNPVSTYYSRIYMKPALIFEFLRRLDNKLSVGLVVELDVNP